MNSLAFLIIFQILIPNTYLCNAAPETTTIQLETGKVPIANNSVMMHMTLSGIKWNNMNYYKEFEVMPNKIYHINIVNNGKTLKTDDDHEGFGIIQLHSFHYNLNFLMGKEQQVGQHLGFVINNMDSLLNNEHNFQIFNNNSNVNVSAALILVLYNKLVPRPGICSLTSLQPKPVLEIKENHNKVLTVVNTHPGGYLNKLANPKDRDHYNDPACSNTTLIKYSSYYKVLPKYDFSKESYFKSIKELILPKNVIVYAKEDTQHNPSSKLHKLYHQNRGIPIVFVTTIKNSQIHELSANYIPILTYSCNPTLWNNKCYYFSKHNKLIATAILFALIIISIIWRYRKVLIIIKFALMGSTISTITALLIITGNNNINIEYGHLKLYCIVGAVVGQCIIMIFGFLVIHNHIWIIDTIVSIIINHFIVTTSMMFYLDNYFNYLCLILIIILNIFLLAIELYYSLSNSVLIAVTIVEIMNIFFNGNYHMSVLHHINFLITPNNYYQYVNIHVSFELSDLFVLIASGVLIFVAYKIGIKINDYVKIEKKVDARYPRFYRDPSHKPLITRWTDGDDEVFETPTRNAQYFNQLNF